MKIKLIVTVCNRLESVTRLWICDITLGLGSGVEKVLILSYSMLIFLTSLLILDLFQIGDVVIKRRFTVFDNDGSL